MKREKKNILKSLKETLYAEDRYDNTNRAVIRRQLMANGSLKPLSLNDRVVAIFTLLAAVLALGTLDTHPEIILWIAMAAVVLIGLFFILWIILERPAFK